MSYFPLHGSNHLQLKFYTTVYCKILNVCWTLIASKRRIEKLNFSIGWLPNVKNLVFSNGCEHVRNVIQWD